MNPQVAATTEDFTPLSGLPAPPPLPPFPDTINGEKVYRAGIEGVGLPSCYYMPNPPYTEAAKEVGYSGIIIVEGAVGSDGLVRAVRIVKGAPFGLNEAVVHTVSTWKCKPAMLDGKSVATVVPFEVSFGCSRPTSRPSLARREPSWRVL